MIECVVHCSVEVDLIARHLHAQVPQVEHGIASHQGIEGPGDDWELLLQRPESLVLLQGRSDPAIARVVHDTGHMGMQHLDPAASSLPVSAGQGDGGAHGLAIGEGNAGVATGVGDCLQQVRLQLRAPGDCGPHGIADLADLLQFRWTVGELHLDTGAGAALHDGSLGGSYQPGAGLHLHTVGDVDQCAPTYAPMLQDGHVRAGSHQSPASQDEGLTARMVADIRRLVEAESPTESVAHCRTATEVAQQVCAEWLGEAARIEEHDDRPILRWGPAHPRILLLGHLDTVWPVGTLRSLPWSCDGERMRGPGVFDMKAGVVTAIVALSLVQDRSSIGLMFTTDEETGSWASRAAIAQAIESAEAVLVFEPSLDGKLKSARKGTSWYRLQFTGRAAHAGLDPERGVNALLMAAHCAATIAGLADNAQGSTVTPTMLTAGTTANTVPARAELVIDVRAWSMGEQERIDQAVRSCAAHAAGESGGVDVLGGIDRPAMVEPTSASLVARVQAAAERRGLPVPGHCAVGGASDGNLTAAAGVPTLDGLGPLGDGAHADHEWVSVADLVPRTRLITGVLTDLTTDLR